jgi:hypothetical protein
MHQYYRKIFATTLIFIFLLTACSQLADTKQITEPAKTATSSKAPSSPPASPQPVDDTEDIMPSDREYEIITLLPFDAIPAINDPQFWSSSEADNEYDPDELVLGVEFDGDARAYSVPLLSRHEIVNDTVGGRKIAVTW